MKKIAGIVTTYFPYSHADVILTKFMKGIPTDEELREPRVELASIYLDQIDARDIGQALAWRHQVPIFQSIRAALTLGGSELAVDGVVLIGEHGDYPLDEQGRHMYPRRYFFEQIAGVFASSGRSVPVFHDKHLAYNWADAKWIYDRARALEVPFLAGSTLPTCWRNPWLEYDLETLLGEALAVGYGGVESYGFHALETLQCMVERRRGGETGVAAVQCLEGEAVWEAERQGRWSRELAEAACAPIEGKPGGTMDEHTAQPAAFLIEYRDGLRAAMLMLNGYVNQFAYAGRDLTPGPSPGRRGGTEAGGSFLSSALPEGGGIEGITPLLSPSLPRGGVAEGRGEVRGTEFYLQGDFPHGHFNNRCLNIEELVLTGQPLYPAERTLLTTGILDAAMTSRHLGHVRVETPHLAIAYRSYETPPWRATGPRPAGANLAVWPPR
jgi:hypothetical protein